LRKHFREAAVSKQILFVDDSETLRELASMSLEVLGDFEVTLASDGLQAKKLLENRSFDLVITDLDMPRMGGDELIEWMMKQEGVKDIPVVVLSAGADKVRKAIALDQHIETYLEKPFEPGELTQVVQDILG
jgi:CheY-like chemotaxis protein